MTAIDKHADYTSKGVTAPIVGAITPARSDADDLAVASRALYIGGDGSVKVSMLDGSVATLVGLAPGMWHPMRVARVWNTGTTATDILVGY